jgi:hypothetical protein
LAKVAENKEPVRNKDFLKRFTYVPPAPIFIASTEDIGTVRVRANHLDAAIDYFQEQEQLKKDNVPIS